MMFSRQHGKYADARVRSGFARPELADRYLRIFDVGLTSARALFAKRRMGKSAFLEQDLIPAARGAGYVTVYLKGREKQAGFGNPRGARAGSGAFRSWQTGEVADAAAQTSKGVS